ncbi:MAG TPA: hypothetical protein VFH80_25330 [Solirubrobacteraceae bacterium]|nr:hypothetical protein [Solirubrobacteraceae bacterium]
MTAARRDLEVDAGWDDSHAGLAMFVIFIAAVLSVTGAVALVALVGGWWMLGGAFAIHVLMTTLVVVTIARVMDGRASTTAGRRPAADHRRESRPPAPTEPLAAL